MFNILCLDQSSSNVGWAIFRDAKLYKYGFIDLKTINKGSDILSHAQRRQYMFEELSKLIKEENIEHIIYEDIFNKNNIQTVIKLAKVQGEVEHIGTENNVSFEEIKAVEWRSYLPLKCESKKREDVKKGVCEYIQSIYPDLKDHPEDTNEAVAIGIGWINKQNRYCI